MADRQHVPRAVDHFYPRIGQMRRQSFNFANEGELAIRATNSRYSKSAQVAKRTRHEGNIRAASRL